MSRGTLAVALAAALGAGIVYVILADTRPEPRGADEVAGASPSDATRGEESTLPEPAAARPEPAGDERSVAPGDRIELEAASLPRDRPVELTLLLPEAATGKDVRIFRIAEPPAAPAEIGGSIRPGTPGRVRLEIEPGDLAPGAYLVQLETDERSHFPVRRYLLEVR